jgi:tetratricopeptide (TPR) repeat protein
MQKPIYGDRSLVKSPNANSDEKSSILFWCSSILLTAFFIFGLFNRGLFNGSHAIFDGPIFTAGIILSLTLLLSSFKFFFTYNFKDRTDLIQLLVWLIPLSYYLSKFTSVSSYNATVSLFINCLFAILFVVGLQLAKSHLGNIFLLFLILLTGYLTVVFGFMNWFGDASFWGLMNWSETAGSFASTYKDAVLVSDNQLRLSSVFQYPNSYAAYLIALILASTVISVTRKNKTLVMLNIIFLVPAFTSLYLTLSRGGLVTLPIILLFILPFLTFQRQILTLLYLFIAGVISVPLLKPLTSIGFSQRDQYVSAVTVRGWAYLLGASLLVAVLVYLLNKFLAPKLEVWCANFSKKKLSFYILPLSAILIGTISFILLLSNVGGLDFLPEAFKSRLENINLQQHSVLERETFYRDSIKIIKDNPLLGAGGGAWLSLYEKYQNNPYTSNQAHNFILQYIMDVGIFGFIFLCLFLGTIIYHFIRSYLKKEENERNKYLVFYVIFISIFIHSFIDFDLSYIILGGIVFISLGGMLAINELPPYKFQQIWINKKYSYFYPAILIIGSVSLFATSIIYLNSNKQYFLAIDRANAQKPVDQVIQPLDSAIDKFKNPEYLVWKINLLTQLYDETKQEQFVEEATKLIHYLNEHESYNKAGIFAEINFNLSKGDLEQALLIVQNNTPKFVWSVEMFEHEASIQFQLGAKAFQENQPEKGEEHWNEVLKIYDKVKEQASQLELAEGQLAGRYFGVTSGLSLPVGQVYFYRGDYAESEKKLFPFVTYEFSNGTNMLIDAFYLAAMQKQYKDDIGLYNSLIDAAPEFKSVIEQLTK